MQKIFYKILSGILLCIYIMAIAGCGRMADADEDGPEEKQNVTVTRKEPGGEDLNDTEKTVDASEEMEAEELSDEEAEALQAAQIRHYYSGVISELTAARRLPDMEIDTFALDDGFGEMRDNTFTVTDIDGDGREELIINYTNASMAGMFEVIYDYDPQIGQLRQEFLNFPALSYYDNGVIIAEASHNHSRGEFWPITLYRYREDSDSYEWIGYADTWSGELSETYYVYGEESKPFPEELDVDGDRVLYNIQSESLDDTTCNYEDYRYNKADYEAWYQEIMAGAREIMIERQPAEYASFENFTPDYLAMLAKQANSGRTDTGADLGLLILNNKEEFFLDAAKKLLAEQYGVTLRQPDLSYEEYTVGEFDGKEIFSFTELNAGILSYTGEKVGDVTIFGIYPGMSAENAWNKLKVYGFYASPYGEVENCLITGEGFGNISVTFMEENGKVTTISAGPFCAFAG